MIQNEIHDSGSAEGQVTLFAIGSITGLSTIEYDNSFVKN
jgi:hypothetical protein